MIRNILLPVVFVLVAMQLSQKDCMAEIEFYIRKKNNDKMFICDFLEILDKNAFCTRKKMSEEIPLKVMRVVKVHYNGKKYELDFSKGKIGKNDIDSLNAMTHVKRKLIDKKRKEYKEKKKRERERERKKEESKKELIADIKSKCYVKWGDDYAMVEYCVKKQLQALVRLQRY